MMRTTSILLILATTMLAACPQRTPPKSSPTPSNNGSSNNELSNNGSSINGSTNNGSTNNVATNNISTNNSATDNSSNSATDNSSNSATNNTTNNSTNNPTNNDPCRSVEECAVEGTACSGETLVVCAPDIDGCLVETETNCAAAGEVCDATSGTCEPTCSDDAECVGASGGDAFCQGETRVSCVAGADGCLDATTEDCAAAGGVCEDATATCYFCTDDAECAGLSDGDVVCTASADGTIACSDLDNDGCLDATTSLCGMDERCDDSGGAAMCEVPTTDCPKALQTLTCADAGTTIMADTANDTAEIDSYACATFSTYPGRETVFVFEGTSLAEVTVTASFDQSSDMDLFALDGDGFSCTTPGISCRDSAQTPSEPEEVEFVTSAGETTYIVLDPWTEPNVTAAFTLSIDCVTPTCGDGIVSVGEECDDDNTSGGDGCDANCQLESGFVCDTSVEPTVCEAEVCGDGIVVGAEECDDMNTDTGDGCDADCQFEFGFVCDTDVEPTVCEPDVCGDGRVTVNEWCDDGNTSSGDGCDPDCEVEDGYNCDDAEPSVCTPYPSIGQFAAGETIPMTSGGPLPSGESFFYTIEFTTSVLLSGSLTSPSGDVDIFVADASGSSVFSELTVGDESWSDELLQPGIYTIEVNAWFGHSDVPSYDLDLSTTVP